MDPNPPIYPGPNGVQLFGEDADELLLPAISPLATRLASPLTPRAEKVAILGGPPDGTVESSLRARAGAGPGPGPGGAVESEVDSDDAAEPASHQHDEAADGREDENDGPRASHPARHRRSTTVVGVEALKRFQKAFPSFSSMQLPSGLRHSIASGLFSGSSSTTTNNNDKTMAAAPSRPKHLLRRVTSDDSLLYHTISRASFDDDEGRFDHIHSMASVRIMAIRESLPERPTFKMPSLLPSLPSLPSLPKISTPPPPQPSPPPRSSTLPSAPSASTPALDPDTSTAAPLDRVLETLTGDIVVLGGYRGSVLRDASPPHHQLWAPVKLGLNMRKADLEVGLDPVDEETMEQRIIPSGMLQRIGPIDISRKLLRRMRACDNAKAGLLRVWDYGYDWRLSPALLSRKLEEYLERLPCNRTGGGGRPRPEGAWVIAHSLGGMLTRHVVNRRPELFAGVVYVGVPQRCVNILGPIRNGDAVLLNEKILTARVNFSLRTSFAFLPEDGFTFVDRDSGEDLRINFYDVDDWKRYRLSPCIEAPLPALSKPSLGSLLPSLPALPTIPIHLRRKDNSKSADKRATTAVMALASSSATTNSMASPDISTGARIPASSPQTDSPQTPNPDQSPNPNQSPDQSPNPNHNNNNTPSGPYSPTRAEYAAYLARTLAATKKFRSELAFCPALANANAYPPLALMYGRDVPTVYAARVAGRDAICRADAYDDLVFRGGDGVVLAREAMLPQGYSLVKGGKVLTERGHVTMLGDLAGVGRALAAVARGRRKGVGLGER